MKKLAIVCGLILLLGLGACQEEVGPSNPTALSTKTVELAPIIEAKPTPSPTSDGNSESLALVNGLLVDGTGAEAVPDAAVLIVNGRIAAVGPRDQIDLPANARVIDVQGAAILPGFFNAHVHGGFDKNHLLAWAKAGVTTVRDLGAWSNPPHYDLREETSKDPKYTRLVSAGLFITAPRGYPSVPWGGIGVQVTNPEEARAAVQDMLDQGADLIKISQESGDIFDRAIPIPSLEEVQAIVAAAHAQGTRVSAHVSISADLAQALEGGVDDAAHMVTDRVPDGLIEKMVGRGMYWVPTLELWKNVGQGLDQNVIDNLRRFVAAGGQVALGTDYEGYTTPFELGMPLKEMGWMQEAGMTPMQIIMAGTRNAAIVSNLGEELGTLEVGKIADVLVVRGNPLEDLQALAEPLWVIHAGEIIVE